MQSGKTQITGAVIRTRIALGSKSDRVGVVLRTKEGDEYILRRMGGNAFRDTAVEALIGSTITGNGIVSGHTFVMTGWRVEGGD